MLQDPPCNAAELCVVWVDIFVILFGNQFRICFCWHFPPVVNILVHFSKSLQTWKAGNLSPEAKTVFLHRFMHGWWEFSERNRRCQSRRKSTGPVLYRRTLLFIHPIYNSLYLLIENSQSFKRLYVKKKKKKQYWPSFSWGLLISLLLSTINVQECFISGLEKLWENHALCLGPSADFWVTVWKMRRETQSFP